MKTKDDKPFLHTQMRKARRDAGLSQLELAEKMDTHRNTIIRWESNVNKPTVLQVEAMALVLNQPVDFFYTPPAAPLPVKNVSTDWTRNTTLRRLQELTPEALSRLCKAEEINLVQVAHRIGLPSSVVKDWSLGRAAPSMEELNLLRSAFGNEFDPTPTLARNANRSLAQRVARMEKILFKIYAALKKANLIDEGNS